MRERLGCSPSPRLRGEGRGEGQTTRNDEGSGVVMMGGHDAESQNFRASEAAIRGFWKQYRALMGT